MTGDLKSIKINSEVKKRLDFQKKRSTYSVCIEQMLDYFEMTGLEPKLGQVPPVATINKAISETSAALYKRMDDVIKILRNIETTKIDVMVHTLEDLKLGKISNTPEVVESFDNDEIYRIIQLNEKLTKNVKDKEIIIQNLQNDIVSLKKNSKIQNVIEAVDELLSENNLIQDTKGNLILPREYRDLLIEKIKTISDV
ncbi:BfmA/BtgA family mobilization protein [Bacteroides eggerthii]|uniref:BfmA/BtgA family mobilization protein n=1 Tax=Bacteroides eggerthii TaxID=28111 RepID=UPI0035645547